jgi:hypothetical protein
MRLEEIALEYRGASLGDMRRSKRLERIGLELARNPDLSFPEAMGTEGQLEALYRFLNNDGVTFEALHASHAEQTRLRCQAQDRVLVPVWSAVPVRLEGTQVRVVGRSSALGRAAGPSPLTRVP